MLKKRFLFLIINKHEVTEAIKFAKELKKKYEDIECDAIYVRDIMKYELFPTTIGGVGMHNAASIAITEYKELEKQLYEDIKKELGTCFRKVYSKEGETIEIALEEMKAYDVLVAVKNPTITPAMKDFLRYHYKPIIILGPHKGEYKFDKILMLNDGGYKVNKSVYAFLNIFGLQHFDVLRINVEEQDRLSERFGDICNIYDKEGDPAEIILNTMPDYDMILMGDLRYAVILERITGQVGIKIIEGTDKPIFIG